MKERGWCFWGEVHTPMNIMISQWHYKVVWVLWVCLATPFKKDDIQLHDSLLPWDISNILRTFIFYFGYFGYCKLRPPETMIPGCRKLWSLSSCKKYHLSLTTFLKYCYNVTSLLFWVLWTCLVTPTKTNSINL